MKTLVVFYSLTGKTRLVAQAVAKEMKADLVEIEETKPRKMGIFLIGATIAARRGKASEIKPVSTNVSKYDRIFIGSPIWGARCAPAVNSFVANTNLKDKKLVLFFSLDGSGYKGATKALTNSLEKHDGKVAGSFFVISGKATDEVLIARAKEALAPYQR
jgi:flavodoxin